MIASIRAFNRFYTQFVGALDSRFLGSDITLAEARLLFEINRAGSAVAADLQTALGMDAGYLSRLIGRFEERGWIFRDRGTDDARRRPIRLTPEGRAIQDGLDTRQRDKIATLLHGLSPLEQGDLVSALSKARALLDPERPGAVSVRAFRTGDMGLIVARQALLYAQDYGWGPGLEINECDVAAAFLRNFRPGREQCWVAELDGVMAGSIFLTDEGDGVARLRLLYVESVARGRGIGNLLVTTCLDFARACGYASVTLWTHTILESARRLYAAHGFRIVETAIHDVFGTPVQGETWRLDLVR